MTELTKFLIGGFYPYSDNDDIEDDILKCCSEASKTQLKSILHTGNMSLLNINCHIRHKVDDLELFLECFNQLPDVLFLTET